ncbi:Gfo/Idh/MocA family protein [Streptomyces spectabilis]|uniref:Gfo/Idh/MocA family oxidoreductase n=1 Tax=Streptomyces spectabilis TaxID=68270 RepID=A0A516R3C8_STRST|nr:Gfo/Idh/MocA family oxidoreductase [Streptomyces spectabilis]QDQ10150.1 Gfo/Idh/MocA family oxidoreductase [Streptomyces spectabilis]
MTRFRVGLIGTGPWATATHAPVLAAHPDAELAGVWGRRPEAAAELAAAHATTAYEDVDALIAASDAVAFAVPPDVQAPLAVRAARAGRHLLLDKPVATDAAAARALAAEVERAGVASVVFFTLRFAPPVADWLAARAQEGPWFTGRADWYSSFYAADGTGAFDSPWRASKGGLWDVGPHALSVLTAVLGEITSVTAAPGPADTVHLVLRHAGGASSTATLTLCAPERASGVTLEFRGEHGTVSPEAFGETGWGDSGVAFQSAVSALMTAAHAGRPHACDVRFGAQVTEILAAAENQVTALDGATQGGRTRTQVS